MEKEKRHTCIVCKKKRNESLMEQILFESWILPDKPIKSYHWVCKKAKRRIFLSCLEAVTSAIRHVKITAVNVSPERT